MNTAEFLPGDFTRNADYLAADRAAQARHHRRRRARAQPFRRRRPAGDRAARQFDRRQHVHARLRLSDRRAAALGRGDRKGDRDERRGGADESSPPSATAAARRSTGRGRSRWCKPQPGAGQRLAQAVAILRRDGRRGASRSSPPIRTRATRGATARWSKRCARPKPRKRPGQCGLAEAVARYLFKLMAYKDEYEVARLYTDSTFHRAREVVVRRRPALRIPSGAAAAGAARPGDRRAEEDVVRPVDAEGVRRAGEVQVPARHAARSVRL